jgi:hypothetical protein
MVCRNDDSARRFATLVRRGAIVRLAVGGEFLFRSGLSATCVREVKGLEFDHVIVPDATEALWPDTRETRRALYVAATRAMRQLVLASTGSPTRLVSADPARPRQAGCCSGRRRPASTGTRSSRARRPWSTRRS